ncbi:MAG: hypothetical protein JSV96_19180 [Candidatus Aminicenantes bacterium]|nr:MAG: hypothetical protein JSV96_19180 [Candidatus Aminicenantes bacterium]
MKKILSFCFLNRVSLFIILILGPFLVLQADAQKKFWVPSDPPQAQYKIDARIDLPNRIVEGEGTVTFRNKTSSPISVVAFDWSISSVRSMQVSVKGKSLNLLNTKKSPPVSSPLLYELPRPLKPGSKIRMDIAFSRGGISRADAQEIKLVSWHPRLWWGGLPNHDDFEVKLNTPAGYALAASGRFNKKTDYYENKGVATFGIYLGKDLKTETREVKGVLITSLFTEAGSECARLCLDTAADVVKFYRDWLGFYPFKFLYIIPGATRPMGGYPFASGIVVIHGQEKFADKPLLHWKWITAHEIGHQYWGEYVMDDDIPSWLWIGLGIYADREYTIFRNLGMDKHIGLMNRYLSGVRKRLDTTIDIPPEQFIRIKFDHNNIVKHGKGFSVISALECVLGKETFERIYKKCLKNYGGKCLRYKEFWRVSEAESGQSLKWFFDQWVRSNKYLSYQITSQESIQEKDKYISAIRVECQGSMQMPVPVKAVFEDGSSEIKYTSRLSKVDDLIFESPSKLKEAILDPDKKFAMIETPLSMTAKELSDLISQLPWQGAGESALNAFKRAESLKLDNTYSWYKLGLTLFDGGYIGESFNAFKKATELNIFGIRHFSTLVWMGHLQDLLGNREEALKYYREALKHDTGRTMQHDQYGMRINRQWIEERLKTPFKWGKR